MNRFVKNNLTLFVVLGCTIAGALVLLVLAVLSHARMYSFFEQAEKLRDEIKKLDKRPRPVKENEAPMRRDVAFFRRKTAELLPHFGQIKTPALNAFLTELGVEKDKFKENFKAAWEGDADRKLQGGRLSFYQRFSRGMIPDRDWAAELKLTPAQRQARWNKAVQAFKKEYQKLTVEVLNEDNLPDILLSVLGVPRNFENHPERFKQRFMLPMQDWMLELCSNPPPRPGDPPKKTDADLPPDATPDDDKSTDKLEVLGPAVNFGFDYKNNPQPGQIVFIVKNWEVIGDLVRRMVMNRLSALNSFTIRKLEGEQAGRYTAYHYTFSVTGEIANIRAFAKNLNDAAAENRMYIIRSIFLYADRDGAREVFLSRQEELQSQRSSSGDASSAAAGNEAAASSRRGGAPRPAPEAASAADPDGKAKPAKTAEQIRAEQMKKPYHQRTGYGQILFGDSRNCEAVFDVDYVFIAEPELE